MFSIDILAKVVLTALILVVGIKIMQRTGIWERIGMAEVDRRINQALSPVQRLSESIWCKRRYRIPMCLMLVVFPPFFAVGAAWYVCAGLYTNVDDLVKMILLVAMSCFMVVFGIANFKYKEKQTSE